MSHKNYCHSLFIFFCVLSFGYRLITVHANPTEGSTEFPDFPDISSDSDFTSTQSIFSFHLPKLLPEDYQINSTVYEYCKQNVSSQLSQTGQLEYYCNCSAAEYSASPLPPRCFLRYGVVREAVLMLGGRGLLKTGLSDLLLNNNLISLNIGVEFMKKPFSTCASDIRCSIDIVYAYSPFGFFVIDTPGIEIGEDPNLPTVNWLINRLQTVLKTVFPVKITHIIFFPDHKFRIQNDALIQWKNLRLVLESLNNTPSVTFFWNTHKLKQTENDSKYIQVINDALPVGSRVIKEHLDMEDTHDAQFQRIKLLARLKETDSWFKTVADAATLGHASALSTSVDQISYLARHSAYFKSVVSELLWIGIPTRDHPWVKFKKDPLPILSNPVPQLCGGSKEDIIAEFNRVFSVEFDETGRNPRLITGMIEFFRLLNLCEFSAALLTMQEEWNEQDGTIERLQSTIDFLQKCLALFIIALITMITFYFYWKSRTRTNAPPSLHSTSSSSIPSSSPSSSSSLSPFNHSPSTPSPSISTPSPLP